jgi:hypothetical protein
MAKTSKQRRPWTDKELEYLSDHYGTLPDDILAQRLDRTKAAIKRIITRRLKGLRRAGAFYTARVLASVLGYKDSKAVRLWIKHGWLKAMKGPPGAGPAQMWNISEDDVVALLKEHPWLAVLKLMEEHYFRSVVKEEWSRDPWYGPKQVAGRLGLRTSGPVLRYISKGWLKAEKQPGGPEHRGWVIRESAIREFLNNDPRKQHRSEVCRAARIGANLKLGIPARLNIIWQIQCPSCGDQVQVTAPPWMAGHKVKDLFVDSYTNGNCSHGASCSIPTDCLDASVNNLALAGLGESISHA